jgi:ABC-type transport system substrate-binding protein
MSTREQIQTDVPLRVASTYAKGSTSLDPAKIVNLSEYELLRNLYGRLVTYDLNGSLIPDVAESFYWEGDSLIFTFSDKLKTVDGIIINADDAAISLKRAMVFGKTGHGNLKEILCPSANFISTFSCGTELWRMKKGI